MADNQSDPISPWFISAEELGEYIGIRFGFVPGRGSDPEWTFLRHTDFDGIGGFAHLLRERGAEIPRLPQVKHPSTPSWLSLICALPKFLSPRRRVRWRQLDRGPLTHESSQPPQAVAWSLFDECSTTQIRRVCRKTGVTVNSFLLKHLTKAIRPSLEEESSVIPWMIPVNLRGKVARQKDIENHSSYVGVKIQSYETVQDVHRKIYAALGKGEHWANWYSYKLGRLASNGVRKYLLSKELATSQWNLGGFSNLGDWDSEKKFPRSAGGGGWLFCPPVLRFQLVGAGCVTFQNRLSLTVQAHPDLTTNPAVPRQWLQDWIREIEIDLVSVLAEPLAVPSLAA